MEYMEYKENCRSQFLYVELKEFMDIFFKALKKACKTKNFDALKKYFTDDARYNYCISGVDRDFLHKTYEVTGPEAIVEAISQREMYRFDGWTIDRTEYVIDATKADIIYTFRLTTPHLKKDGSNWKSGYWYVCRLHYVGSYQVNLMEDLHEENNVIGLIEELEAAGLATEQELAWNRDWKEIHEKEFSQFQGHLIGMLEDSGQDPTLVDQILNRLF